MKPVSKCTLGEACTVVSGGTPKRSVREYWEGGDIPWVKISDLGHGSIHHTEERITRKGLDDSAAKLLPSGAVLVSIFATIGATGILATPACTNQAIAGIVPKESYGLTPRYIYYWLQSQRQFMEGTARGVAQNNINLSVLRSMEIPLYSKPEQSCISDVLANVDALLNDCKKLSNTLDKLVKSRFIEMFGDPDNNPNGCSVRRLGDVVSIERGGSPRPISQYVTSGEDGVNWIKIGDTSENSIYITKTEEKIKPSGMKKSRYVQPGDFLLSNSMSFGRPYILKTDGCIHDGWLVLRDSSSAFDKLYLYALLDSEYAKRFFAKKAVGTTVRNLNKEIVGNMPVLLPPSEKQIEYADFFTRVDKLRFDVQQQIEKLEILKKSLMQEYFG